MVGGLLLACGGWVVAQQSGSAAENAKTKPQRRKNIPKPGKALKWHVKGALPDVLPVCWLGRRR